MPYVKGPVYNNNQNYVLIKRYKTQLQAYSPKYMFKLRGNGLVVKFLQSKVCKFFS